MKKVLLLIPALCLLCCACNNGNGSYRNGSQTQENSADWQITTKVKAAIMSDSSLSASARFVSVTTNDGVVTLSGNVASQEDRDRIVRITRKVNGVRDVDNQMMVTNN